MRVCSVPGCPEIQPEGKCAKHRRAADRARGSRQQRGYDAAHNRLRAEWQRRMDAGERVKCWRCGQDVDRGNWTLGHCDVDRSTHHGPECPACDYATAGRTGCPHRSHYASGDIRIPLGGTPNPRQ